MSSAGANPAAVALTTPFAPAGNCNNLIFSAPLWYIWYDEPLPLPGVSATGCYPSEWLAAYSSAGSSSSIAPFASPLVCPSGWTTASSTAGGNIACCPTGYTLHPPDTTVDSTRPFYGGKCYSNINAGQVLTITQVDGTSVVQTQTVTTTSSAQAYAHVIDGIAMGAVAVTTTAAQTPTPTSTPSTIGAMGTTMVTSTAITNVTNTASNTATGNSSLQSSTIAATGPKRLSAGVTAVVVISLLGLIAAIAVTAFFLLPRWKHRRRFRDRNESNPALTQTSQASEVASEPSDDRRITASTVSTYYNSSAPQNPGPLNAVQPDGGSVYEKDGISIKLSAADQKERVFRSENPRKDEATIRITSVNEPVELESPLPAPVELEAAHIPVRDSRIVPGASWFLDEKGGMNS